MKLRYIAPQVVIEHANWNTILSDTEVGVSGELDLSLTDEDTE